MVNGNIDAPFKVDLSGNYIKTLMRKQLLLILLLAAGFQLTAQKNYFIYIQSDKYQPFYVNLDKNILSSSDKGHLIIAKLGDSTIQFSIGFPKGIYPEQKFHVSVNKRDQGFQLKNFGEKGWGLFNLQTLAIIYNDDADKPKSTTTYGERRSDNFSALLANVVNDSAVLYAMKKVQPAVVVQPAVKKDTIASMEANGTTTIITGEVAKETKETVKPAETNRNTGDSIIQMISTPAHTEGQIVMEKPAVPATEKKDSIVVIQPKAPVITVRKILERRRADSYYMVFTDKRGAKTDTIRLSIPFEKDSTVKEPEQQLVIETAAPKKDTGVTASQANAGKEPQQQIVIESAQPKKDSAVSPSASITTKEPQQQIVIESTQSKKDSAASSSASTTTKEPQQQIVIKSAQPKKDSVASSSATSTKHDTVTVISNSPSSSKETEPVKKETAKTDTAATRTNQLVIRNSDCENFATDNDVDKLRIKLLAEKTIDDRLLTAKKYFRTKCFQVKQVRALTELFPRDEDKYQFFDTAYPFISDTSNFHSLETLIADEYYKTRFKAMIRK